MITITDTELEGILKSLLQQRLCFVINKKHWREGRLLLFKQNGFYLEFTIRNDKDKNERFDIPIPFDVVKKLNTVVFSYKLNSLICNRIEVVNEIRKIQPRCRSKYFDNYIEIQVI